MDSSTPEFTAGSPQGFPVIPDHTLIRRIGGGSYGEVWLARTRLDSYRAVKIVHRSDFVDDRPYEREFAGIRRFEPISRQHPSQLPLLHVGRNDDARYFFYLMEAADDLDEGTEIKPASYEPKTLEKVLRSAVFKSASESASVSQSRPPPYSSLNVGGGLRSGREIRERENQRLLIVTIRV